MLTAVAKSELNQVTPLSDVNIDELQHTYKVIDRKVQILQTQINAVVSVSNSYSVYVIQSADLANVHILFSIPLFWSRVI